MDVGGWVRKLGLEQYEAASRKNGVNADVLRHLTVGYLKDLALSPSITGANFCKRLPPCALMLRRPAIRFGLYPTRRPARPTASSRLKPLPTAQCNVLRSYRLHRPLLAARLPGSVKYHPHLPYLCCHNHRAISWLHRALCR